MSSSNPKSKQPKKKKNSISRVMNLGDSSSGGAALPKRKRRKKNKHHHQPSVPSSNAMQRAFARKDRPVMAWIPRMSQDLEPTHSDQHNDEHGAGGSNKALHAPQSHSNHVEWHNAADSKLKPSPVVNESDILLAGLTVAVPVVLHDTSFRSLADDDGKKVSLPSFGNMINFPEYRYARMKQVGGKKHCVMCGNFLPYLVNKKCEPVPACYICVGFNGICNLCEGTVWQLVESDGVRIKFCRACHNFRPLSAFVGLGNKLKRKCCTCREKDRKRNQRIKVTAASD